MGGCWSEVTTNTIEQGDLIADCEIPSLPASAFDPEASSVEISLQKISAIVLTQTCQIEQQKVKNVVICRVVTVSKFDQGPEGPRGRSFWSNVRSWRDDRFHLLHPPSSSEIFSDLLVADFREIHTPSVSYLKTFAVDKKRARLLSPYLEHLAQRFGYYFMKIALPSELPPHS
jgi:hypothetical protein